ncbi:Abi family protein [Pseudomonas viridiflava]|uniref:Abi family protein n=1 Tax=Pseudomonas viridiflava TaxID=33069 RepID=UPI002EC0F965|nr:Abi family protein [Pseudomonas viridiflava]
MRFLEVVTLFRLSPYMRPFQKLDLEHIFRPGSTLKAVVDIYRFDGSLRRITRAHLCILPKSLGCLALPKATERLTCSENFPEGSKNRFDGRMPHVIPTGTQVTFAWPRSLQIHAMYTRKSTP